jgi:hypothetical protein
LVELFVGVLIGLFVELFAVEHFVVVELFVDGFVFVDVFVLVDNVVFGIDI